MINFLPLILFVIIMPSGIMANTIINDDEINLYCLKKSYPQIIDIETHKNDEKWLVFNNGSKIPYRKTDLNNNLDADIYSSMEQIYPLEPLRIETPYGFAPGRRRPYPLFYSLYGKNKKDVQNQLISVNFLGTKLLLSPPAADALEKSAKKLELISKKSKHLKKLLKPEGGFFWRNIAGEKLLSAHSFGIAIDLGVEYAPYWRWNKEKTHILQKTWPEEIVSALEEQGFIWGGKWHEYDLMHFEYRPELICKAKIVNSNSKTDFLNKQ